jgi:single-strand DNA-binding protein
MLKAHLIGNLGSDPERRYSTNGSPYLRLNVAANQRTRTPEGEWVERTEWVRVTVTGQRAETLSQYPRKGTKVYVEGALPAAPRRTGRATSRPGWRCSPMKCSS